MASTTTRECCCAPGPTRVPPPTPSGPSIPMQIVLREGEPPRAAGPRPREAVRREEDQEACAARPQQPQEVARWLQEGAPGAEAIGGEGEGAGSPEVREDQAGGPTGAREAQKQPRPQPQLQLQARTVPSQTPRNKPPQEEGKASLGQNSPGSLGHSREGSGRTD